MSKKPAPKQAAPKATAVATNLLPTEEEEVQLPDGIEPVPEPPFSCCIVHLAGHTFSVEGGDDAGSAADDAVAQPPPLLDVDLCARLLAGLREESPEDPIGRQLVPIDRDELVALAEGGPLAKGLRRKFEKESDARRLRKLNAARNSAIARVQGQDPQALSDAENLAEEEPTKVDLVLVVSGYPASEEDLNDAKAEGIFDLAGLWLSVYLAGRTMHEEPVPDAVAGQEVTTDNSATELCRQRVERACEPPPILGQLSEAAGSAELGTGLANSSMVTVSDSEHYARIAAGVTGSTAGAGIHSLRDILLEAATTETSRRLVFDEWMKQQQRIVIPDLPPGHADTKLYSRLVDALDPVRQDVPSLLYCLCEQVELSLSQGSAAANVGTAGGSTLAQPGTCSNDLVLLERYLDAAHGHLLHADVYRTGLNAAEIAARPSEQVACNLNAVTDMLLVPHADYSVQLHGFDELPGGVSVASAARQLIDHIHAMGLRRVGFPDKPPLSSAQRSAHRNRLYALLPDTPVVEVEQLVLLHEFEDLLTAAQPERRWSLRDRLIRERIPASLLAQVLLEAFLQEPFLSTRYIRQRDCLLIVLHYRALPAHVLWHSWSVGSSIDDAAKGPPPLCPTPSFSDWWQQQASSGGCATEGVLPPPATLVDCDAREMGYCKLVEKLAVPAGGTSVVLETAIKSGVNPLGPAVTHAAKGSRVADSRSEHGLARALLLRQGVRVGIVSDIAWANHAMQLREERLEAEAAAAAAAAAEAEAEAQGDKAPSAVSAAGDAEEASAVPDGAASSAAGDAEAASAVPDGTSAAAPAPTERLLEEISFGHLWLSFPDGGRFTARIHHERPWYAAGTVMYDSALVQPGILATYSPTSGVAAQVTSDSVVRLLPAAADLGTGREDVETSRIITPLGAVIRTLRSGRHEVYFHDGTRAFRNPTATASMGPAQMSRPATAFEKVSGLPGHWVVTRADGQRVGRVATSVVLPADATVNNSDSPPTGESLRALLAWLSNSNSELVDGGDMVEYEVDPVQVSFLVDPHTGEHVSTSSDGLLLIQNNAGTSRSCLFADGTRISWSQMEQSHEVYIEKAQLPSVVCRLKTGDVAASVSIEVMLDDGARLEVVPRFLNHKRELAPCDPHAGELEASSTNASVQLRRQDGTIVMSEGSGIVRIINDASAELADLQYASEEEADALVAHLDRNSLVAHDCLRNEFEVCGDQKVNLNLAVSMGNDAASPDCIIPGVAYRHPDGDYLPLPKDAPPPRLLVVYGDGEAEELLSPQKAYNALRIASADPNSVVVRDEPLAAPAAACRCHTIFTTKVHGVRGQKNRCLSQELPPSIAGLEGCCLEDTGQSLTVMRQFVEYPAIIDDQLSAFDAACQSLAAQEQEEEEKMLPGGAVSARHADQESEPKTSKKMGKRPVFAEWSEGGLGGS